jgi:Tol biopolymer transport system component
MRSFRLFVGTLALLGAPLAAQQRHTVTHEDVYLSKRIGAPAISPDGRWVVFSVTEPSYTEGEQVSDLWLVPVDGKAEPRRLTNSKSGEGGVDWSHDSRRIAFSARREGDDGSQIYVLDLSGGGEAQRVTNLATGASSPQWRPDGRAILFTHGVPWRGDRFGESLPAARIGPASTTRASTARRSVVDRYWTTGGRICS